MANHTTPPIRYYEKTGYYTARITIPSNEEGRTKRRSFYGHTIEEVESKLKDYYILNGMVTDAEGITFGNYFRRWLYKIKQPDMKPRSFRRYESLYDTYIKKAPFVSSLVQDVIFSDLKSWYGYLQIEKGVSVKTVDYVNMLIRSMYFAAKADRLTLYNPSDGIKFRKGYVESAVKALSAIEQVRFLDHLKYSNEPLKELFIFALGTGLRLGECLCLRWSDIDFDAGYVHVKRSLERVKVKGKYVDRESTPKSPSSIRDVPIPTPILNMLKTQKNSTDGLVFPGRNGKYIFNKMPTRRLAALCSELGLPELTFHNLRHTYATRLFEQGVFIRIVQKLMGHADSKTTNDIYTHVMPDIIAESAKILDKLFQSDDGNNSI